MKKKAFKILGYITLFSTLTLSCERDDICAATTSTTPRLLIEFFDVSNPDDLKNVPRLTAYSEDLADNPTTDIDATLVFNTNTNAIELPLVIVEDGQSETVRYVLEKDTNLRVEDENASTVSNIDIIEITYTSEFIYVSRACGYKSIFNDLSMDFDPDSDNWINSIQIVETIIENENTVHVNIFH